MKAEEYLKENRFESAEYEGYDICYGDALEAVKMDREEMKEKAIEAFQSFIEEYCSESGRKDIASESEHYIEVFKSKLEKEQ